MDSIPLQLAFSRLGVDVTGRQRPLCATAQNGSLVMVCHSSGFSRPGAGVLRYSAKLSLTLARRSQIEALRQGLSVAVSDRMPIRLIIQTPGTGRSSSRIHVREDLVGSIAEFDGDAYCVDFVRLVEEEPEPRPRRARKR